MNKRRLLLFSVFALLHITTSERNFIDGSYGCCNHSSRYLSSNTEYITSGPHRVQQLISVTRDPESTQLTRRQRSGLIEPYSRGDEIFKIFGRHRNRILTTPSKEIVNRRNLRGRIAVYRSILNNDSSKFASFSSRYNNRINEVYTNRFEGRRISGFNYNDRDADSLYPRDTRNGRKRDLLEHDERSTQRHASRDSLRDYSNYDRYTEIKVLPQKLVLDKNAYRKANLHNNRRIIIDREITFNQFAAKRFSGFNAYRNLNEELSQKELRTITSRYKATDDMMNLKYNKRVSNEISRRLLIRDTDYLNSLIENQERSERVHNGDVNEIGRGTRDIKLELREASRFRDYVRNKRDEASRIQNDRQNIDRFDVHRKMEDRHNHRRVSSEQKYMARYIPNDRKIQFHRKYKNYNVRYNRDMKERIILEDNNAKNRRVNDNRENINFEETNKRVNIFESRYNNDPRNVLRNWLSDRRSFIERSLERDYERKTRNNLSMEHSQVRDQSSNQIRESRKIRRNIDNSSDRILRRNRLTFSLVSDVSGRDEIRRKLADLQFLNDNIISGRRWLANRRDQNDNKMLNIRNVRRSLEKQRNLREDENRITTRLNIHVITPRRRIRIDGPSTENVNYQRSRNVRNRESSRNNRLLTRKLDDEKRKTKQSQEDRSLNTRRLDTINENRYSVTEFFGSESSRTDEVNYGSNFFEIKLQYLFYALQFAYLLSVIMQIPKINEENKQKNRIVAWLTTPAEYFKID